MPILPKRAIPVSIALALGLATTLALAKTPKTPLGKWMNANISSNMSGDPDAFTALKTNLALVAGKPPAKGSYPKWADFANAGIAAANKQDLKGVKATCKGCHDAYQDQYIKENLTTPFP